MEELSLSKCMEDLSSSNLIADCEHERGGGRRWGWPQRGTTHSVRLMKANDGGIRQWSMCCNAVRRLMAVVVGGRRICAWRTANVETRRQRNGIYVLGGNRSRLTTMGKRNGGTVGIIFLNICWVLVGSRGLRIHKPVTQPGLIRFIPILPN